MRITGPKRFTLLVLGLAIVLPTQAKKHETGFLDRTIALQGVTYKYQFFVPEDWTPHEMWPIILFLHGSGERGDDGLQETDVGICTAIRSDRSVMPAIVVMPQCEKNVWWIQPPMDDLAMASLEAASKEFHGDERRTYLTGLSMGGYGTWHLAEKYPGKFAALIVICGGLHPAAAALKKNPALVKWTPADDPKSYAQAAAKIGKIAVWIFHGADDDIVPVIESRRMYAAMKQLGADVHYTEYPGVKHNCWDRAYDEPKLFPWLFAQSLPENQK
ncbi:MAG: alpha/beta hydrolase-fold protein [Candidatus Acidiferrales bacterium]